MILSWPKTLLIIFIIICIALSSFVCILRNDLSHAESRIKNLKEYHESEIVALSSYIRKKVEWQNKGLNRSMGLTNMSNEKLMLQDLLETKAKGKILRLSCMHLSRHAYSLNLASVHVVFRLGNKAERRNSQNNSSNP